MVRSMNNCAVFLSPAATNALANSISCPRPSCDGLLSPLMICDFATSVSSAAAMRAKATYPGRPVFQVVARREDVYRGPVTDTAPDLLLYTNPSHGLRF